MKQTRIPTEEELKQNYIQKKFDDESYLKTASDEEKKKYADYVMEGLEKDWPVALYAMAYGCYGGNEVFECDWVKSRDCLLKLIDIKGDEDPYLYNTLGYIYYYGRCNNGVGEYDLAFKYFSVGAANGVFESMYKTADMYIQGKGVPKSKKAGAKIILGIYDENREIFSDDNADCKFADVALRVGGLFERGTGVDQDYEKAYYHYLEAEYAILRRMDECDRYGDGKVAANINEALNRVKDKLPEDYFKESLVLETPAIIGFMLTESVGLDIELKCENGTYYLKADRYASEDMASDFLLNIPETGYCTLTNSVLLRLEGVSDIDMLDLPKKAFINSIERGEEENSWVFGFREMPMIEIKCKEFIFDNYYEFN